MTTLVIGSGLIGSQVARILAERGETPVLMDVAAQREAIGQIVPLDKVTLIQGDVLRPRSMRRGEGQGGRLSGAVRLARRARRPDREGRSAGTPSGAAAVAGGCNRRIAEAGLI